MSNPSQTTFVLVPGAWHSPYAFSHVSTQLRKHGYDTVGVFLPATGAYPPLKSFDADVLAIQSAIMTAADDGQDVVVVMHSYGGVVGCEGLKGLSKVERSAAGRPGGVIRLAFLCAFVLQVGASLMTGLQMKPLDWFVIEVGA